MLRKVCIVVAIYLAIIAILPLDAQPKPIPNGLSVVQRYRAQYPTPMGSMNILAMLKKVAGETGGGIYRKSSGENCGGFSCDIICFPNERVWFDVLGDAEGSATPSWSGPMPMDPNTLTNCVLQIPGPINPPAEVPIDPTIGDRSTAQLQQQQIVLLMQMLQKQEEQSAALQRGLADLKAEISKGIKVRF